MSRVFKYKDGSRENYIFVDHIARIQIGGPYSWVYLCGVEDKLEVDTSVAKRLVDFIDSLPKRG